MFAICTAVLVNVVVLGVYLGNTMAFILPEDATERDYFEDYEIWKVMGGTFTKRTGPPRVGEANLRNNKSWILIFLIPVGLFTTQLLNLLLVHSYETPKWYLLNGDESSAVLTVNKIYQTKASRGLNHKICLQLKSSSSLEANKIGFV